jgi:hydroxyethylthiazole kinase-like uncharacterized protein yjeF
MIKLVNSEGMTRIDQITQERYGLPALLLMENAGIKLYEYVKQHIWPGLHPPGPGVFLVGKGNNGGDALVIARQCIRDGFTDISIILAAGMPGKESLAGLHLNICRELGIRVIDYTRDANTAGELICGSSWIIDGILGTGISSAVHDPVKNILSHVNTSKAVKIAIDIPSGIGDSFVKGFTALQADHTLTIELPKSCLYLPYARSLCGRIHRIKIGFPPQLIREQSTKGSLLEYTDFFTLLPSVPGEAHKTTRGHCAVFAGAVGTTGAAFLCANAAARSRTGLVTLFADEQCYPLLAPKFNSVMIRPCGNVRDYAAELKKKYTGLLIGPGWGLDKARDDTLETLISLHMPGVIDADGITLLAALRQKKRIVFDGNMVLTPHPGECIRLCGGTVEDLLNNPLELLSGLCRELNTPVILKGHVTYLVCPNGDYYILDGMNPALATGGSGDVLAGIIAGFLTGGLEPVTAARLGLLLHSAIGAYAFAQTGWFLAEDLLPLISLALRGREGNPVWE